MNPIEEQPLHWPNWSPHLGFGELASYVSVRSLRGHRLSRSRPPGEPEAADRAVVGELFDLLAAQEYEYLPEEWSPKTEGHQPIRHLAWVAAEGGNCLDLSLIFAAMCLNARVAPLLAVSDHHAFVVVRPGHLTRHRYDNLPFELSGTSEPEDGVREVEDPRWLLGALERAELVAIDCVRAAQGVDGREEARSCDRHVAPGLRLIDVPYLHEHGGIPPRRPPVGWPTVSRFPPDPVESLPLLAAQQAMVDRLEGAEGVVAILANPGMGKSTVARHLRDHVATRAGWFLNASDPQALVDGLAAAELAATGEDPADLERPDREGFALAALTRLRNVPTRWVVVLDNADGDPSRLARFIPKPGKRQLVVITTTNPDWRRVPNVETIELKAAGDSEIRRLLNSEALTELVAGRPLLIEAFSRLMRHENISAEELAAEDAGEGPPPESRAPAVYWHALRGRKAWFGAAHLRLAALAAHLPADHLPAGALVELADLSPEDLEHLVQRGLFTHDEDRGILRLHRLFGAAIRDSLEDEAGLLLDVTQTLLTDDAALSVLQDRGDLDTVRRLLGVLEQSREARSGDDAINALRGLAMTLELRGATADSGRAYTLMADLLDSDDPRHERLRAEHLHAQARIAYRSHKQDEQRLLTGLEQARRAHAIANRLDGETAAARYLAMQGLIMKELAVFPEDDETVAGRLQKALSVIEKADALRTAPDALPPLHPERARSRFNLAGAYLMLAQHDTDQASEHLDAAEEVYRDVNTLRRQIFKTDVHAQIAVCVQGLGLVSYYRAILVAKTGPERSRYLREATRRFMQALEQWEEIEAFEDEGESAKVNGYLFKAAAARKLHPQLREKRHLGRDSTRPISGKLAPLVTEVVQELGSRHELK